MTVLVCGLHAHTGPLSIDSFNDQEIVALSGAHAMGRCHTGQYLVDRDTLIWATPLTCTT